MVRSKGFEPLTFWFVAKHSIQLSYERITTFNFKMVAPAGIEPATQGFSVLCSTDWAMEPKKMAVPTRIELAIFCVTGRRDNRYTTEPFGCGRRIWTYDLWVMSPASYQAAPSRDININGGERGIRTPAPFPASWFSRPVPSTRLGYFSNIDKIILSYINIFCQ